MAEAGDFPCDTVAELLIHFWDHATVYYRDKDGKPTSEIANLKQAIGFLVDRHGGTLARDFGPVALKEVREGMIRADRCRSLINKDTHRIKGIFRWAVENDLVPSRIYKALRTVAVLMRGRCKARESEPVRPVADAFVDAIKPHVETLAKMRSRIRHRRFAGAAAGCRIPVSK